MRIVRRRLFPGEFDHEMVWLAVSVAALVGGTVWLRLGLPWPQCPFLGLTGYPCLTCGATRCSIAFLHGNVARAFAWNPLALVALCSVALFDLYAAFALLSRSPRLRAVGWTPAEKGAVRIAAIALIVLNWGYLVAHRVQFQEPRSSSSLARAPLHLYARAMRTLVTGGAGFIGSHLVEKLLAAGHEVSILDDFNEFYDPAIKRANIAGVAGEVPIHRIDLRDNGAVSLLFHREKFDAIIHLAARAGVRPSINQPQLYYDTNVTGTLHLLEAARRTGIECFIFASSSSVYGICQNVPFSEDEHLTQTISPYAATKVAGEFLCSTYSHLYQMRIVALRFFTVYGARQRPDLAIHQFTRKIHAGQPIDQFGDGTTRRDYTYIDDIIQGVSAALEYRGPLYDLFNLGESETIQLKDLIAAIEEALGKKAKINELPEQPGDVPLTCADISKARKLLNYNPTTPLSAGLPKFVEWFLRSAL